MITTFCLFSLKCVRFVMRYMSRELSVIRVSMETGNLENGNGHGKVMEHDKLAKRHGIL